jgi:hypothetical protein
MPFRLLLHEEEGIPIGDCCHPEVHGKIDAVDAEASNEHVADEHTRRRRCISIMRIPEIPVECVRSDA